MQIRPVRAQEAEAAGRLTVAAYATVDGLPIDDEYRAELADVARRAVDNEVLVAVDDTTDDDASEAVLLGCVTFVPGPHSSAAEFDDPGAAGIRMLGVDPAARGRGVGEALTRACLDRATQLGCRLVVLHTTSWMRSAQRLYERMGFERAPELDWAPHPGLDLLGYRYPLAPGASRSDPSPTDRQVRA